MEYLTQLRATITLLQQQLDDWQSLYYDKCDYHQRSRKRWTLATFLISPVIGGIIGVVGYKLIHGV